MSTRRYPRNGIGAEEFQEAMDFVTRNKNRNPGSLMPGELLSEESDAGEPSTTAPSLSEQNDENQGCEGGACSLPGPERGGYKDDAYSEDLMEALTATEEEVCITPVQDFLPTPLKISQRNLELGYMIGPITAAMGRENLEVGGFFTTDLDDGDFSLTDFIVPRNLPVTTGSIKIAEHYPKTGDEIKELNEKHGTKKRLSAMFHIHPMKEGRGMFHSHDDDEGLSSLVNKMARVNRIVTESPYRLIQSQLRKEHEGEEFVLRGSDLSDTIIRLVYPNDQLFFQLLSDYGLKPDEKKFDRRKFLGKLLDMIDHRTTEPRIITFATSFVFENDRKGPYVQMEVDERFVLSGTSQVYTIKNPKLEVIRKGENLPKALEVRELVKERVKFPVVNRVMKRFKKVFSGGKPFWVLNEDSYGSGNSAGGTAPSQTGGQPYQGPAQSSTTSSSAPIAPEKLKKVSPGDLDLETIADLFSAQVYIYTQQYRNAECLYSHYMARLFETASKYSYSSSNNSMARELAGNLRKRIIALKELKEDEGAQPNNIMAYEIRDLRENLIAYLNASKDQRTLGFMRDFVFIANTTDERNRLLSEYVAQVHDEYKKQMESNLKQSGVEKKSSVNSRFQKGNGAAPEKPYIMPDIDGPYSE